MRVRKRAPPADLYQVASYSLEPSTHVGHHQQPRQNVKFTALVLQLHLVVIYSSQPVPDLAVPGIEQAVSAANRPHHDPAWNPRNDQGWLHRSRSRCATAMKDLSACQSARADRRLQASKRKFNVVAKLVAAKGSWHYRDTLLPLRPRSRCPKTAPILSPSRQLYRRRRGGCLAKLAAIVAELKPQLVLSRALPAPLPSSATTVRAGATTSTWPKHSLLSCSHTSSSCAIRPSDFLSTHLSDSCAINRRM